MWSSASGLRFLGDLPGGAFQSVAYDINENGTVVGSGTTSSGVQAFVWDQTNGMNGLELMADFTDCLASAINNGNPAKIVGYCYSSTAAESCIWNSATGRIIESLGGCRKGTQRITRATSMTQGR